MNKRIITGTIFGAIAGVLDVIPMLIQNLTWDANLSAFSLWVVAGFTIASSGLALKGPLKGLVISLLLIIPCAVLIGWKTPVTLIPILSMTVILGSALGYCIDRFAK